MTTNAATYFVTGTDTEIGKTTIACAILKACAEKGLAGLGLKPVAAGCEFVDGQWQNEDALALMRAATVKLDYAQINPIALPKPIAPHLAASEINESLNAADIVHHCCDTICLDAEQRDATAIADLALIEGAGGWLVPLNDRETFADIAIGMNIPVVLVIGVRLGCINHALLTVQAIQQAGLPLAAWVANCVDPNTQQISDVVQTLMRVIDAPCMGVVPFIDKSQLEAEEHINRVSEYLSLDALV